MYQTLGVARVQTDTRFVQHIERPHQTATQTLSQVDTLTLAARQGRTQAVQGQITQTHILHKLQAVAYLGQQLTRGFLLTLR